MLEYPVPWRAGLAAGTPAPFAFTAEFFAWTVEKSRMMGRDSRYIRRRGGGHMPCPVSANSFRPRCSSGLLVRMPRAGCTLFTRSAARVTVPSSYREIK